MDDASEYTPLKAPSRFMLNALLVVAVAAGLLEALVKLLLWHGIAHRPIWGDERLLWMLPAAYLIILLVLVSPLVIVTWWSRGRSGFVAAMTVLLWPALFALSVLQPNLHQGALAILSLGVAVTVSRWLAGRSSAAERSARRLGPAAMGVLITLAVGFTVGERVAEKRRLAGLPEAGSRLPNVILLVWDTVRAANVSLYGYPKATTPRLTEMARDGMTFQWAFAAGCWSTTSHAVMVTGLLEQEMRVGHHQPMATEQPTVAEVLAGRGYVTGAFVGNETYAGREYGLDEGFLHFEDHPYDFGFLLRAPLVIRSHAWELSSMARRLFGLPGAEWLKSATKVNADLLRWIDARDDRPFFALLNYMDAHAPYQTPRHFRGQLPPLEPATAARDSMPASERLEAAYDHAIEYLDAELGRLLDSLQARGLLKQTIVIVTADHGEHLGEHGLMGHNNSLYQELLHVPLVIHVPGRAGPAVSVATPVSLRDIPATIADLVGMSTDTPFRGKSLRRYWTEGADSLHHYRVIAGETTLDGRTGNAVIAGGHYFITWPGKPAELYAFPDDSTQSRDLAGLPEYQSVVANLKAVSDSLDRVRKQTWEAK